MKIQKIPYNSTLDFILKKHYAQRVPSISMSYGLFIDENLLGVLTLGKPASNALCEGVCGKEHKDKVYELNRLIVDEGLPKNTLSKFVGGVLKDLKEQDLIIVSYSDTGMGHNGYIYQATNFIYTGVTKQRTDKYVPENKHSRHYDEKWNHLRKVRTAKHRYIFFTGKTRKKYLELLKYPISSYPKGENSRYQLGERMKTQIIDTNTNNIFFE